jgi:hypothetical protein
MTSPVARFATFRSNFLIRTLFVLMFVCGGLVFAARTTHAASLFFSPATGSYTVGKTFTVNVMVASSDQAANAYSGTITYPTDKLEMTAIGRGGSIVSLWVQDPSFTSGRANFEGVTFNPGYKGGAGRMVSLTFRAKAAGTASVRFSAGSVLANDGEGTNILTGMGSATFNIVAPEVKPVPPPVPPAPPPVEVIQIPSIPLISSISHPDPDQWYATNRAMFVWGLQAGVNGVSALIDQNPTTDPGTVSAGLFSSSTYENVQDGIWYFHLRVRNRAGWSVVSHFRFLVDATKPDSFVISEVPTDTPIKMAKAFIFDAVDSGSGIDHYEVQIDGESPTTWVDDGTHVYNVQVTTLGDHTLHAKVFDKAGNFLEPSVKFTIEGLAAPRITEYSKDPVTGDELVLKGLAVPNSRVTIWIQKGQEVPYTRQIISEVQGRFAFVAEDTLELTTYQVWANISDAFGNISPPSDKITILVQEPPFDMWAWTVSFFVRNRCILIISLLLLILLILTCKYFLLKRKMRNVTREAQEALQIAFSPLKEGVQDQINVLEKTKTERQLTAEENAALEKLKQDLVNAENYIRERIEAIGKAR